MQTIPAPDLKSLSNLIMAIGALGTASFGLVDATKAIGGGISRVGMHNIKEAVGPLFGQNPNKKDRTSALAYGSILGTLRANWMNGTALTDQKAIAKQLLKLRLSPGNSAAYAAAAGVPANTLQDVATQINQGGQLTAAQADVFGRFDLALTALLDEGYQRADQRYRNACKILAGFFAIIIAAFAGWLIAQPATGSGAVAPPYWWTPDMWKAALAGALAMPLAPIAKDLTSALAAGVDVVQKMPKKA